MKFMRQSSFFKYFLILGIIFFDVSISHALPPFTNTDKISEDCPAEKPFKTWASKECHGCDEPWAFYPDPEHMADFDQCSNRETVEIGPYVKNQLKICPPDFPIKDSGNCLKCDFPVVLYITKEECQKCPNRQYLSGKVYEEKTDQYLKSYSIPNINEGCYLIKNNSENRLPWIKLAESRKYFDTKKPEEGSIIDVGGYCFSQPNYYGCHEQKFYPCDVDKPISTTPEGCALCPNRKYVNGECVNG